MKLKNYTKSEMKELYAESKEYLRSITRYEYFLDDNLGWFLADHKNETCISPVLFLNEEARSDFGYPKPRTKITEWFAEREKQEEYKQKLDEREKQAEYKKKHDAEIDKGIQNTRLFGKDRIQAAAQLEIANESRNQSLIEAAKRYEYELKKNQYRINRNAGKQDGPEELFGKDKIMSYYKNNKY